MKNIEQIEAELTSVNDQLVNIGLPLFGTVYCSMVGLLHSYTEDNESYFIVEGMSQAIRFSAEDVNSIKDGVVGVKDIILAPSKEYSNF